MTGDPVEKAKAELRGRGYVFRTSDRPKSVIIEYRKARGGPWAALTVSKRTGRQYQGRLEDGDYRL